MIDAKQTLVERASIRRECDAGLSQAVIDALRLAEMFDDIKPEEFGVPSSDALGSFRPQNMNRMLFKTV